MFYCTKHVPLLSACQIKHQGGRVWILSVLNFSGPRLIISLYFWKKKRKKGQIWNGMWNRSRHYLCLASLFTIRIDSRSRSRPLIFPRWKEFHSMYSLFFACFVCTRILVVLQYRNLLLLCGGISKPVVHCRSLIYSLLHCSLYVCSACELDAISTVRRLFFFPSVHGVTMTGNEWRSKDAHLRVLKSHY